MLNLGVAALAYPMIIIAFKFRTRGSGHCHHDSNAKIQQLLCHHHNTTTTKMKAMTIMMTGPTTMNARP